MKATHIALALALAAPAAMAETVSYAGIPYGSNFYASDYTLTFTLNSDAFSSGDGTYIMLAYWGSLPSNGYGSNAYAFTVSGSSITLSVGVGSLTSTTDLSSATLTYNSDNNRSATLTSTSTSEAYDFSQDAEGTVYTLSVTGASGSQTVSLSVDGEVVASASYNGNMNGTSNPINAAYDNSVITLVPEPATATLGLLALGALALRRRRA